MGRASMLFMWGFLWSIGSFSWAEGRRFVGDGL